MRRRVIGEVGRRILQAEFADLVVPGRPLFLRLLDRMDGSALLGLLMRSGKRGEVDAAVLQTLGIDDEARGVDAGDIRVAAGHVNRLHVHLPLRERHDRLLAAVSRQLQRLQVQLAFADLNVRRRFRPVRADVGRRGERAIGHLSGGHAVEIRLQHRQRQRLEINLRIRALRHKAKRTRRIKRAGAVLELCAHRVMRRRRCNRREVRERNCQALQTQRHGPRRRVILNVDGTVVERKAFDRQIERRRCLCWTRRG